MDFRKFLEMVSEKDLTEAKKKKPDADGDGVPDWADKKPGKDDHAEDEKDKKKSLKDWFEIIDKNMLAEQSPVTGFRQPLKITKGSSPSTTITDPGTKATITTTSPSVIDAANKGQLNLGTQHSNQPVTNQPVTRESEEAKDVEESGLQAYLGKKKYGKKGMAALQKAGRDGASKEKMAQIRAKHDKLDEVEVDENLAWRMQQKRIKQQGDIEHSRKYKELKALGLSPEEINQELIPAMRDSNWVSKIPAKKVDERAKNPYAIGMAAAKKQAGITKKHATGLPKKVITKGHEIAKKIKKKEKMDEVDQPTMDNMTAMGANLGAGRNKKVLETMKKAQADKKKQKVKESMQTNIKAAYQEGYAHGLREQPCRVKHYSDMEEAKQYFEGYKYGLDECYGMGETAVIGETPSMPSMPASVPAMANASLPSVPAMEADMEEGNAFTAALAKTPKGGKFSVGGKTFTDTSDYNSKIDEFAFESLEKQLNELLNEGTETINEGLSVNMSQGLGGMGEDTVSVSATGDDASKLLDFIKQVGLGGLGGAEANHGEPEVVAVSDYGAPKFSGHDGMAELMKKVGVDDGSDDFKSEKSDDHEHSDSCGCKVDEVESSDQMLYNVAEDDSEGNIKADEQGAQIDSALAGAMGGDDVKVDEGGDGGEASEEPVMSEESKSEEDDHAEKAGKEVAKDIEHDEGHKGEEDDHAEKGGEEVTKDIEYDDKKDEKEKVDEWANDAGKKGTDQAFEEDIDFMTRVISGGLNKPKATGQTTIPVIAGQEDRMGVTEDSDVIEWKRLAGIK